MTNKEIHFKYIIFLLVLTIIGLIVLRYYDVPDLVDKLTFSLTLSSLLLSLLAIFYTITTGVKQDNQFTKLIETHSELKSSAREIRNVSTSIDRVISKIPEDYKKIQFQLENLSNKSVITDSNKKSIKKHYSISNEEDENLNINREQFVNLFLNLSLVGMGSLYVFVQFYHQKKTISFKGFPMYLEQPSEYSWGIYEVFQSLGLIEYELVLEGFKPLKCNEIMINEIDSLMTYVIQTTDKKTSNQLMRLKRDIYHTNLST